MATVAACVPTRNRAHYLAQSLQSILDQTRRPDRIVISDDASTDDTPQVVADYTTLFEAAGVQVAYFRHDPPLGQEANRRFAFQQGECDYLAMLDDDDLWMPAFLQRLSGILEREPRAALVFGSQIVIGADGQVDPKATEHENQRSSRFDLACGLYTDLAALLLAGMPCRLQSTIFRREALQSIGFVPVGMGWVCDWGLYCALAAQHAAGIYVADALTHYRIHATGRASDVSAQHVREAVAATRRIVEFAWIPEYAVQFSRDAMRCHAGGVMDLAHAGLRAEAMRELVAFVRRYGVRRMNRRLLLYFPLVLLGADRLRRGRPLPKASFARKGTAPSHGPQGAP